VRLSVLGRVVGFQFRMVWRGRDNLLPFLSNPLFALLFLMIVRAAGRRDLTVNAVIAPVLITLWVVSLDIAGDIVEVERWYGTLDATVSTPVGFPGAVLGRVVGVTALGLVGLVETWLVARVLFGISLRFHHPAVLAATLGVTTLAILGTALVMASVFVLSRSSRNFQNALTYPFFLLGGVLVPVSLLPGWLQPLCRLVFLSWSADLLRDSVSPGPLAHAGPRLLVVALLGVGAVVLGQWLLVRMVDRLRRSGTLSLS
jgi:ABC-2 type transport system permease protein